MTLLLSNSSPEDRAPIGSPELNTSMYGPDTGTVVGAFVDEAFKGVGTWAADSAARKVERMDDGGTPFKDIEEYKLSPSFRPGVGYYGGMTSEAADVLAEFNDEQQARSEIISRASTLQKTAGFSAAMVTGFVEPKNLVSGVATTVALGPVWGAVGPFAASMKRISQMRKMGTRLGAAEYGTLASMGAVDGMISAAITEPSNQYSARVLQQDYTMNDTLWNVGLSTVLGVGLVAGPSFIRDRFNATPNKISALNTTLAEIDASVSQLALGQKVDVEHVESMVTKTPEFVARQDPFSTELKPRAVPADNYTKGLSEFSPVMYRQAHPANALEVMPYGNIATEVPELYLADNLDFAAGQGKNKNGVLLAFDTANLKGRINKDKPTWQISYEQGMAEFIGRHNRQSDYQKSLVAVRVPEKLELSKTDSMMFNRTLSSLEKAGWNKIEGDGFTEYRKPSSPAPANLNKAVNDAIDPANDTAIDARARMNSTHSRNR